MSSGSRGSDQYVNYLPIWHPCFKKICVVVIIITCLGLAVASWLQPGDDSAVSMETLEEIVGLSGSALWH